MKPTAKEVPMLALHDENGVPARWVTQLQEEGVVLVASSGCSLHGKIGVALFLPKERLDESFKLELDEVACLFKSLGSLVEIFAPDAIVDVTRVGPEPPAEGEQVLH